MAKNNETTTKFKVDISELKKSMQEARKQVAYANSEFKAVSSSLDDWSKSSDGLNAKLKQLHSNLEAQEKVLNDYEGELERIKKEYGENSKEALEYGKILNDQRATVNYIKKDIAKYEEALEDVSKAEKIASKTGKDVAEVLEEVAEESKDAGEGFTVLKGAVAEFVGNGLSNLVGGIKDAISSFMSLADETREYREDLNKLETAFTTAGFTTEQATAVYKDFYAVLGEEDRSVEAVNHLAKLVDSEKDLKTWTDICTGVWATFGDSLPIEGLTEASNETAKTGKLTGGLADALNWAGESEEAFQEKLDSLNTEQERSAFITETLNALYGDTANVYRENNASIMEANRVNSDYADTMAKMGATIEPVTTTLKAGFTELLNTAMELFGGELNVEAFTSKLQEGFSILSNTVLPAIKDGLGWILANKDGLISALVTIASGFLAFNVANMIMAVTGVFASLFGEIKKGATVMKALNTVFGLTPFGLITTGVTLLVAGFLYLWNTCEPFKQFWLDLWEDIKNIVSVAVQTISKFFTQTIPNVINNTIEWFKKLPYNIGYILGLVIGKIVLWLDSASDYINTQVPIIIRNIGKFFSELPDKIWTWLALSIIDVGKWAVSMGTEGKKAISNLITNVINGASSIPSQMGAIGRNIVEGVWNGIRNAKEWFTSNVKSFFSGIVDGVKNALGINSPSKVFAEEVGKWIPEGVAVGISDNAKSVLTAMKNLTVDAVGSAKAGLSTGTTTLGSNSGVVNNFTQVINSPKQLSRLDIYRQSKNLLGYAGGGI